MLHRYSLIMPYLMGLLLCPLLIWSIPWEDGDHGLRESPQLFIYGKTSKFITVGCSQNAAAFKSNIISYMRVCVCVCVCVIVLLMCDSCVLCLYVCMCVCVCVCVYDPDLPTVTASRHLCVCVWGR